MHLIRFKKLRGPQGHCTECQHLKRIIFCFHEMFYIYLNAWKLLSIPVVFNIHSKNAGYLPEFSSILRNANIRVNIFSFQDNVLHFLKIRNINYNAVCLSDVRITIYCFGFSFCNSICPENALT